jgi:hypothetical protein
MSINPDYENYFKEKFKIPTNIYLDLIFCKDIYLSAILNLIGTNEKYNLLLSKLDVYDDRYIDDIEFLIPELEITNEDIQNVYNTIDNDKLVLMAPTTSFLPDWLDAYINTMNNHAAVLREKKIPNLFINTYPLKVSESTIASINTFFKYRYGLSTRVICEKFISLKSSIISNMDVLFLYTFNDWAEDPDHSKKFTDLKYFKHTVFAPKRVSSLDAFTKHKDMLALEKDFIITEEYLKAMCNFTYIPPYKVLIQKE